MKATFFEHQKKMVFLAKDSLSIKRKVLDRFTEKDLYPYSKFYLRKIKECTGSYWEHHFSTVSIVSINEACMNYLGQDIGSDEGQLFALKVMDYMLQVHNLHHLATIKERQMDRSPIFSSITFFLRQSNR